jgi:hypothetical protein
MFLWSITLLEKWVFVPVHNPHLYRKLNQSKASGTNVREHLYRVSHPVQIRTFVPGGVMARYKCCMQSPSFIRPFLLSPPFPSSFFFFFSLFSFSSLYFSFSITHSYTKIHNQTDPQSSIHSQSYSLTITNPHQDLHEHINHHNNTSRITRISRTFGKEKKNIWERDQLATVPGGASSSVC